MIREIPGRGGGTQVSPLFFMEKFACAMLVLAKVYSTWSQDEDVDADVKMSI